MKEYVRNWVSLNKEGAEVMWIWLQSKIPDLIFGGVTFLFGKFWERYVWPSVVHYGQNIFHSGATRIATRYKSEFTINGQSRTELVKLKQRAYRVWGTIISPQAADGEFEFEGTLYDNVLRATYNSSAAPPARGSFLLTVPPGASKAELKGRFVQPTASGLVSEEYKWIPT